MNTITNAFDYAREAIGEEEIASVALEYWMNVDKYTKLSFEESWHLPMLAFQLGYVYAKERYKLDD